jgi:diguanylate cyclase (GGDEF)-like protein
MDGYLSPAADRFPRAVELIATGVETYLGRSNAPRSSRAGSSILIVDDEAALCEGLRNYLGRAGYATEVANNAEAATERLEQASFDLLLCDVQLPGRSGLDLVRDALREHPPMAAIMISALDDPAIAESAIEQGAYGYVVKPFTSNELLMQVRNALKRLELERENAKRRHALEERKELLERLLEIQRSVSYGTSLEAVLESIVVGAQQLLGGEVVALTLAGEDSGVPSLVAARGVPAELLHVEMPAGEVLARTAVEDRVIAHVRWRGPVIGELAVGSTVPGRLFTDGEQEALAILAEHAGVAIRGIKSHTIAYEAFHDPLTNLPNRAGFLEALERMSGKRAGVVLIDLDGFRATTEERGAAVADELLVCAAERVVASTPAGAIVGRLGSDEFGVLLRGAPIAEVEAFAEHAVAAFRAPFRSATDEITLSASAGAACSNASSNDLVRDASVALYRAKQRGRGRWEIFGAAIKRALLAQFDLEADLEGAVDRGEIRVVYQPVVELGSGRVAGFEALARWEHPRRGVVPPLEFIPMAEGLGLVGSIGEHVVNVAVDQALGWQTRNPGDKAPWVSVNFSACELERPDFVAVIATALERTQLPPKALVVEITEGVLIGDTAVARERLEGLRALGARIAIDDFGTGHASLEYLRELPFDILKIAREFCDGADRSPEEAALVRTFVNLAKRYGLDVIGEGIERVGQGEALIEMGCSLGQGYYLGRPMQPEAVESFLEHRQPGRIGDASRAAS